MPSYFDDPDENALEAAGQAPAENASFKELREHARALEKQTKQQAKELEDLRNFRAQSEAAEKLAKAKTFGLSESQAKAFLKITEGEVTPEAVQSFRQEMGLAAPETQEVAPSPSDYPTPQWSVPGFSPVSAGGSFPVKVMLTYDQYRALLNQDPKAAFKAVAEGRVEGLSATVDPANPDGAIAKF